MTGSRYHPREHVRVEIVKANIPVANGVVHLIKRPLIIVALNLWDYLQNEVGILLQLKYSHEFVSMAWITKIRHKRKLFQLICFSVSADESLGLPPKRRKWQILYNPPLYKLYHLSYSLNTNMTTGKCTTLHITHTKGSLLQSRLDPQTKTIRTLP